MKHLIFLVFWLISLVVQAQTITHTVTHQAFRTADMFAGKFGPWSEWEKVKTTISIDVNSEIMVVKGPPKMVYTFVSQLENENTENKTVIVIQATDEINTYCAIELVHYIKTDKKQIYIRWKNFQIVYEISEIKQNE